MFFGPLIEAKKLHSKCVPKFNVSRILTLVFRWMMKNFYDDTQMLYETKLHAIWEQWNFSHRAMLIDEVKRVMNSEGDYAAWTYITSDAKYARYKKREMDERLQASGSHQ